MVPFPAWVARVNRRLTNPILIRLTDRPPFAALTHTGRVTGRTHRIPVNAFPTETGFVIACTYGRSADWVRNLCANGRAELEYDGERIAVRRPRLVGPQAVKRYLPPGLRLFLGVLRVNEYMVLERHDPEAA